MTEAETEERIKQEWIDGWDDIHGSGDAVPVPYTFEGEGFDAVAMWARLTIVPTVREQGTFGTVARMDTRGVIMVQLFGDIDVGEASLVALADDVRSVLERKRWSDIVTRAGSSRKSPTDGRWLMRTVSVPYETEEQTTSIQA